MDMFLFVLGFFALFMRTVIYVIFRQYKFQRGKFHESCGGVVDEFKVGICPKCGQINPKLEDVGFRRTFFFRLVVNRNSKESPSEHAVG